MSDGHLQNPDSIDRVIHEPARLMVLTVLNAVPEADFLFISQQTGLTKGNLSSHSTKLEEAGYIKVEKTFVEKTSRTVYRLTEAGREALETYRLHLGSVLDTLR